MSNIKKKKQIKKPDNFKKHADYKTFSLLQTHTKFDIMQNPLKF